MTFNVNENKFELIEILDIDSAINTGLPISAFKRST